jgi:hypothetical protein
MAINYWIEIETPQGKLELWSFGAPIRQFQIAKALGFSVAYGKEGQRPSKSYPKGYGENDGQ